MDDALRDAFRAALESWPGAGVPDNPDAWLLTAARRRLIDSARHAQVVTAAADELLRHIEDASARATATVAVPDRRLELLFICAHPAIDPGARSPLILQTVLGLDAARIASAFLVKPSTMGQRLARAKTKIREAGLPFKVPEDSSLVERMDSVLSAIYAAYGSGWDDVAGADPRHKGLADEALELGRLLTHLMPSQPEALGLLALMLHCEARRNARRAADRSYVPLSSQNVSLWSNEVMEEAEHCLSRAARAGKLGRFQLEAAIQSAHAHRRLTEQRPTGTRSRFSTRDWWRSRRPRAPWSGVRPLSERRTAPRPRGVCSQKFPPKQLPATSRTGRAQHTCWKGLAGTRNRTTPPNVRSDCRMIPPSETSC